uniref:tRNA(Phe) 7-[(3-amino-3-carboxypropyl)-4-demethylwyosine(37)-N(4)]-methyltransferase n=1 Tax=Phaeodactylum tricornutum TaxID=2850 RepID=A0A8J9SGE2_PHATR
MSSSIAPSQTRKRQFPYLRPDKVDTSAEILSSFSDIRVKTFETIYADADDEHAAWRPDKSPKGFVDEPIRDVVDLINTHPSFATVSSCSGRIALFDSSLQQTNDDGLVESGKGIGGWLMVCHEEAEPVCLLDIFHASADTGHLHNEAEMPLSFKFEPMLLHVAAASLSRGQQLLQLALQLGFRESGLVVTDLRVTVAIRTYSLALTVPLARHGAFRPPDEYLRALAVEANRRMRVNTEKIQRLFHSLTEHFFRPVPLSCRIRVQALPQLGLRSHSAVAVTRPRTTDSIDIIVFGGYGRGPRLAKNTGRSLQGSQRSSHIYCLTRANGVWEDGWHEIPQGHPSDLGDTCISPFRFTCRPVALTTREGSATCVLPGGISIVAIFGGRTNPANPLGDLLLYDHEHHPGILWEPNDIRGCLPEPSWGHTLTAMPFGSSSNRLAVLCGGRNERECLGSIYILSAVRDNEQAAHLIWEEVVTSPPLQGVFLHSAVATSHDSLLLFGGLNKPLDILEAFDYMTCACAHSVDLCSGKLTPIDSKSCPCLFGHTVVPLVSSENQGFQSHFLLTGGLQKTSQGGNFATSAPFRCVSVSKNGPDLSFEQHGTIIEESDEKFDFGSLLDHSCIPIDNCSREPHKFISVGGGVAGFAFEQCFAESFTFEVQLVQSANSVGDDIVAGKADATLRKSNSTADNSRVATLHASESALIDVLYVDRRNAKKAKTMLEEASWLDKRHRMFPADSHAPILDVEKCIALPVLESCLFALDAMETGSINLGKIIIGRGKQSMPLSTAAYANQAKKINA